MEWLLGITIFLHLGTLIAGQAHWGYTGFNGPSDWASTFASCGGKRQSPINIDTSSVELVDWEPFIFENYDVTPRRVRMKNNGHTAKVEMDAPAFIVLRQGGLNDVDYVFAQYHFHWGKDSARGSEHTIDYVRYPLEMYIVHYKQDYGSLGSAVQHSDGLAILGVLFEIGETDNPAFTPIIEALADIPDEGMITDVHTPYSLEDLLPDDTEKFYRYGGSLTTPTCNEAVVSTVFDSTVKISESQVNAFRALKNVDGNKLVDNYRPTQPLHNRKVFLRGGDIPPQNRTGHIDNMESSTGAGRIWKFLGPIVGLFKGFWACTGMPPLRRSWGGASRNLTNHTRWTN